MNFFERVCQIVRQVPPGKVATYGQIAVMAGSPLAARAVGNALHNNPDPKRIPCHRVISSKGNLAENFGQGGWKEQKRKLLAERVRFKGEKRVDLEKYLWKQIN